MSRLAQTLRALVDHFPGDRGLALVGGLAVSARTEPRFTRDLDFAIAVENDTEAEGVVLALQARGFMVAATIEHSNTHRLATVRLRENDRAPFVDLLFAACGVEREIVNAASPLARRRLKAACLGWLEAALPRPRITESRQQTAVSSPAGGPR